MDLRSLPDGLSASERVNERRSRVETELGIDLGYLSIDESKIGSAEEKNCEQMIGAVSIPVGYAGPLSMTFSSGETSTVHLPLATTEGALVASVNRGCKALSEHAAVRVTSIHHGISRSIALKATSAEPLLRREQEWKKVGEETSSHLNILKYDLDQSGDYIFLTIYADTDEAMGMNMVTIAAQKIGEWLEENADMEFVTVAGNVDSDKKPSMRTYEKGRGYEVIAEATLKPSVIKTILKSTPEEMLRVADAKLTHGSRLAEAIGANLHVANIIAALYLATGQDAAHVVEGSLTDTTVKMESDGLHIRVRLPAILAGVRGGGTEIPAQRECIKLLQHTKTNLPPVKQIAEIFGAAVLAGEVSLLAAQAAHTLASSHKKLAR